MPDIEPHILYRICEAVRDETAYDIYPDEVEEIILARTLGWGDGIVAVVQREAREYGVIKND